jgi:hypothetical protein
VSGYILAGLLIVGSVNSDRKATCKKTAIKGEHPFWSIESDDIDDRMLWEGASE